MQLSHRTHRIEPTSDNQRRHRAGVDHPMATTVGTPVVWLTSIHMTSPYDTSLGGSMTFALTLTVQTD